MTQNIPIISKSKQNLKGNVSFMVQNQQNASNTNSMEGINIFTQPTFKQKLSYFHTIAKLKTKNCRYSNVARHALSRIIDFTYDELNVANPSLETLTYENGFKIYSVDHLSRGIHLLEELGIIIVTRRGKHLSNCYELNFDIIKEYHESLGNTTDPCTVGGVNKNKNIRKDFNNNFEEKIISKWVEPEPIPPDFRFESFEMELICKTYNRSEFEVLEALQLWIQYNINNRHPRTRLLQSFNGFCARRNWDKQTYRSVKPTQQHYIPQPYIQRSNARIKAKLEYQEAINPNFGKYKKPKLQKMSAPPANEIIALELEIIKSLESSGMNYNDRVNYAKNLIKQSYV